MAVGGVAVSVTVGAVRFLGLAVGRLLFVGVVHPVAVGAAIGVAVFGGLNGLGDGGVLLGLLRDGGGLLGDDGVVGLRRLDDLGDRDDGLLLGGAVKRSDCTL